LIETKFKSMDNNDAGLLASAYYPRAMSYYIDNSEITGVSITEWVARFEYDKRKGNNKNTEATRKIQTIDLFDEIGYVSFTHTFKNLIVTDKVLVLKIDNRWRIINLLITV
jgi:Putative lumazine-binding